MDLRWALLIVGTLLACSPGPVRAQAWGMPEFSPPHSSTLGQVRLLGIEPIEGPFDRAEHWAPPGTAGGAVPVQYPLDNKAYEGPEAYLPPQAQTFQGQPYPPYGLQPGRAPLPVAPPVVPIETPTPWVRLQQITSEASQVMGGSASDALGIFTLDTRAKIEFPRAPMFTLMPRFGWHLLNGPTITDLPPQLYDASMEGVLSLPLGERLFMQTAVAPSFFTDGHNTSSDAFRLPARLLFFYNCTDALTISGGVVYLDREDLKFLPSVGLIYRQSPDLKVEVLIPRPRVAWRYFSEDGTDRWAYLVGELGGGSWGIRRASGLNDVATYSDYRLLLGTEQTGKGQWNWRFEGGLVFSRSLDYLRGPGDCDLPATGLVRIAFSY